MILTCPECATRYQTDAAAFTPDGRKVRCAKCGHVWFQAAPAPEPDYVQFEETPEAPAIADTVIPQRTAYVASPVVDDVRTQARPPSRWLERLGLVVGWLSLAAIVVVIGWSAVRYRQDIASLWPQSSSLYALLNMPVNTRGIAFLDKSYRYETEDGQNVLIMSGRLVNITTHELSVPPIRVTLIDDGRRELYHWSFSPGVTTLRPGQVAPFQTRLPSPPPGARSANLTFAEQGN